MDLSFLVNNTILLFLLMLIRMTGMLVAAPLFSHVNVPVQLQVGIAVTVSLLLFPVYSANAHLPVSNLWAFAITVAQEFIIGLVIGFVASMMFSAIQLAGSHVTNQMGLGIAHVVDPVSSEQSPVIGQFYFILAILLFLSLNIHHSLIIAVAKSFDVIPLASGFFNLPLVTDRLMFMADQLFTLSVMLIIPVLGIMLVKEIAMAFTAKILPQMNIFMVAIPLKIAVGLILIYLTLPFTYDILVKAYEELVKHLTMLYQS